MGRQAMGGGDPGKHGQNPSSLCQSHHSAHSAGTSSPQARAAGKAAWDQGRGGHCGGRAWASEGGRL